MNLSLAELELSICGINRVKLELDGNDSSPMSTQIDAKKAMNLAKEILDNGNYGYYFIDQVKREESNWRVRATTLANKLVVTISDKGEFLGLDIIDG
jgi:hypothetical protein